MFQEMIVAKNQPVARLIREELTRRNPVSFKKPGKLVSFYKGVSVVTLFAVLWMGWQIKELAGSLSQQGPVIAEGFEAINDTNMILRKHVANAPNVHANIVLAVEKSTAKIVKAIGDSHGKRKK